MVRPGQKRQTKREPEKPKSISVGCRTWIKQAPPHRDWLIKYLLPANSITYISGQEKKAMKTMTALVMSYVVATGRPCGFLKPGNLTGNVLYILEEGEAGETRERKLAIAKGVGELPTDARFRFMFHARVKLDDEEWMEKVIKEVVLHDIKLVVFDTMTYMLLGEENNATDVNIVIDTIQAIRKLGVAVLCLFHLKKSAEPGGDPDGQIRGSGVYAQARDNHIALRRYNRKKAVIDGEYLTRGGSGFEFGVIWEMIERTHVDEDGDEYKVLVHARPEFFLTSGEKFIRKHMKELEEEETYSLLDLGAIWGVVKPVAAVIAKSLQQAGYLYCTRGIYSLTDE